jgi:hypothetical protein
MDLPSRSTVRVLCKPLLLDQISCSNCLFISGGKTRALTIHDNAEWDRILVKLGGAKTAVDTVSVVFDLDTMDGYKNRKRVRWFIHTLVLQLTITSASLAH